MNDFPCSKTCDVNSQGCGTMNIHSDFEEFLKLLGDLRVEYVLVGGYAVAFYGYVRATYDMDVLFRNIPENVKRVCQALEAFGIPQRSLDPTSFAEPGSILRLGVPPTRIELLNRISGVAFDAVWRRRVPGHYGKVPVQFISRRDLVTNKKAAGRPKDLADVDELGGRLTCRKRPTRGKKPRS
jgi:hypothetical protein